MIIHRIEPKNKFKSKLRELILKRMSERNLTSVELSKKLSYVKVLVGANRIDQILFSNYLTIGNGGYDYRYITIELLEKMCEALDIDEKTFKEGILEIKNEFKRIKDIQNRFYGNITVVTDKEYKVFGMSSYYGMMNNLRMQVPGEFAFANKLEQKEKAIEMCKEHYNEKAKSNDFIERYGNVLYYRYFYDKDKYYDFYVNLF